jgi:hypothetical protein
LLSVLPHDRRCRLQADSDGAAFVDKGALGGNPLDDILGGLSAASGYYLQACTAMLSQALV